jgi:hypothetical protein
MARFTTILIVKCMTLWNWIASLFDSIIDRTENLYYYMKDYFNGYHDTWLFVPGHTFPLSLNNLYNTIHVNWLYNNSSNKLRLIKDTSEETINCKFSWLSANLVIGDPLKPDEADQYNIDDFIEKFLIETKGNITPTLYMVFMCWCAYSKHWFRPDHIVEFHIINDMGEDIVLNIDDHNNSLIIKRNKIYVVIHSDDGEITEETENKIIEPVASEDSLLDKEDKKED